MRDEWKEISLEDLEIQKVIKLGRGDVISKKDMEADPGLNPVYSSAENKNGMIGKYAKYMFDEELITWSVDGGGHIFYRPKHKFSVTNIGGWLRILDSKVFSYQFLTYALQRLHKQHHFDWQHKAHPSVIRKLYTRIPLPPLPEQKRIVDLISSVDSYIESLQLQLESAKRSRNAVLYKLLTAVADDWVERKLPDVVEVLDRMRKPINSTEREERKGNIPYYGANGQTGWIDEFIFNEELVLLGEDAIDFADPSARKAYLIQGPSWVNNHAHVLRADKKIINSYFLMESLNKVDYSQYVSFGTRSKLTQASMNGIKVLVPSMKIQEKIVDLLANFDEVIEATQKSIGDSKVLRSGMLSNLLSGEHQIPGSYDKVIGAAR